MKKPFNKYIEHTLLKADATKSDIERLCNEAVEHDFFGVCVNSSNARLAKSHLRGSNVKLICVCGFPLGACTSRTKKFEAEQCAAEGADEIDMVINIGRLKDREYDYVLKDIKGVCEAVPTVKVIIETALLSREEKIKATELSLAAGAIFVKTSTGFSEHGANVEDIMLLKKIVGVKGYIKASGGIKDSRTAIAMIEAGASRIGTSSSIDIIGELEDIK